MPLGGMTYQFTQEKDEQFCNYTGHADAVLIAYVVRRMLLCKYFERLPFRTMTYFFVQFLLQ